MSRNQSNPKKKIPMFKMGKKRKKSFFISLLSELRKKKIIRTLAAFIGGGWVTLEFVHLLFIEHYGFPEKILDITFVTLLCALVSTIIWLWYRGVEGKPRKVKLELFLVPIIILSGLFINVYIILQMGKFEKGSIPEMKWKNSIAVLPFEDLSPREDQEYFCDGMTEEIIGRLSKLGELKVVSRTSVWRYKETKSDIKEIGRELGVETILEGSVRKENENIRVTAQLISVKDGFHLWSEFYDRKLESIFVIQGEISKAIAEALRIKFVGREKIMLAKSYTDDFEANELYWKGRFFWNKRTVEGYEKSLEYFKQAIEKDPTYALAYAGIADYYNLLGYYDVLPPRETFPKAKAAVEKALELDNNLAEAHNSLAFIKENFEWDWEGAEREYKRAIELNPSFAIAHQWYAGFLGAMERHDESIAENRLAQQLDPLSPIIGTDLGLNYISARLYDKAEEEFLKVLEMEPDSVITHIFLSLAYTGMERYREAITVAQKAEALSGGENLLVKVFLGVIYSLSEKKDEAEKIVNELRDLAEKRYVSPWGIALIYVGLEQNDKAFEWFKKAYEKRDHWMTSLKVLPILDNLRPDPRFKALMKKMDLD